MEKTDLESIRSKLSNILVGRNRIKTRLSLGNPNSPVSNSSRAPSSSLRERSRRIQHLRLLRSGRRELK
jgi:hypothetical protein